MKVFWNDLHELGNKKCILQQDSGKEKIAVTEVEFKQFVFLLVSAKLTRELQKIRKYAA